VGGSRGSSFVEVGAGAGWHRVAGAFSGIDAQGRSIVVPFRETQDYLGFFLAAGYTFDLGDCYFLRPQLRVHLYGPPYIGVQPCLADGFRF
jgi:hypothetical protein